MLFLCENALVETMRDCESCRHVRVSDSRTDTESDFCLRGTRLYSLRGLIGMSGGFVCGGPSGLTQAFGPRQGMRPVECVTDL